ncbi:MAG: glycosyl hydrolase 108 family protein [Synergistaceae bacterium]|nr:glycosyl hydrolase 108 family protein [Synergistaceae bacterium]
MTEKTNFEKSLSFALGSEGGFSDHPADRGGKTNLGITAGTLARAHEREIVRCSDIRKLTRSEAAVIYKALYWQPSCADEMPWPLCALHFDAAVNHGVGGAGRLLQRTLNYYGAKLRVDGAVGRRTMDALNFHIELRDTFLRELCDRYLDEREALFYRIVKNNPSQKVFLRGWLNRIAKNRRLVAKEPA